MRRRTGNQKGWKRQSAMGSAYLMALVALGLCRATWAQGQAIDPVNVSGATQSAPSGAIPQPVTPAPANPATAETPAIVPSVPSAVPATATPATPVIPEKPLLPVPPPAPAPLPVPAAVAPPPSPPPEPPAPTPPIPPAPVNPPAAPSAAGVTPSAPTATETGGATGAAIARDGKSYPLTGIKVDYLEKHPQQPPIDELLNTEIRLGVVGDGYVAPRTGIPTVNIKLSDVGTPGSGPQRIYRSGIEAIYGQIVRFFNTRGIIGVFVVVDSKDIDASDNDIRPAGRTTLQFIVVTSVVKQVRTVAIGEDLRNGDRVDNPRDAAILAHSPLKPAATQGSTTGPSSEAPQDLLNKDALDEYVLRLNRLQGRRVDVAVSGTGQLGGVTLDYLVSENRPWYVYGQISNTGTRQTDTWRERFGFVNNQLTNHDDAFTLDYITAGFDASHAVIASYELPFFNLDRVRYKAYVSWNEYTASDVGQNLENFTGNQWTAGNEMVWNFFQKRELFIDLVGGFKYSEIEAHNASALPPEGKAAYLEPYAGLRLERATDIATTAGSVMLVGYANTWQESVESLGRSKVSEDPVVLNFDLSQSFYLEPLLNPEKFATGKSTLAHEIALSARGQEAFGYRLFPQAEDVAGGLYSVRGYPESIVAGDSVYIVSGEYRFHLPRILPIQPDPTKTPFLWDQRFRMSPQQAYGRPDWDLIFKAFVDAGQVKVTNPLVFENNSTLVGTGVGVEFQYKQNFNLRVDWGVALTDVVINGQEEAKAGSNRFHITSTILY